MADPTVRLNKHIADSGLCSRRKADKYIAAGNIRVNGKVVTELGTQIDPAKDVVTLNGQPLPVQRGRTIVFHKPAGCLTTKSDEKGRKTIYDFLPPEMKALDPAGRLDRNTTGVLILSNEGDFIHQITHPGFHVKKTYRVTLNKPLTAEHAEQLLAGITLMPENKLAKVEQLDISPALPLTYMMRLVTGYNRQIRRSLEALGYDVTKLKRTSFGPVSLGDLAPGQFRPLRLQERRALLGNKPDPKSKPAARKAAAPKGPTAKAATPKPAPKTKAGPKASVKAMPKSGSTAARSPEKRQDGSQNKNRPAQPKRQGQRNPKR